MKLPFKNLFIVSFFFFVSVYAQNGVTKIWNGLAPGTENLPNDEKIEDNRIKNVYQPDVTFFLPEKYESNHAAILIFPGGGYTHLAFEKEGIKIAKWLNENGIAAFVLKYRLNEADALADAQRALSFIRNKSSMYNINPNNVGVLGFSAGGHLAANLISHPSRSNIIDSVDSTKCNPDFAIFVYGWLQDQYQLVAEKYSPTFLVHASDDTRVPVEQSINYYNALLKNNVPCEMHIFEKGKHGFAMESGRGNVINWGRICVEWMKERGIIE